ncbi:Helix-turn-helix domain-containing protein [Streptomyces sp. LamerLS-316]|uniref:helix-turn-helix domain-containing protein n=1 Tax=unclassified Streptomyces TaxID=2593676 RepID=UPI0008237B3E|nr:helix-turn-helix transcriptional regulator [Streptomyces sp. LamerLS-316]MYQ42510.1 helix-turn-helix domain-containing protein [Streptomyces sp. SID4921]SCK24934.1 Helix-turn-helix domain-containing protein [Streptomyces sp. LamerLS-316]
MGTEIQEFAAQLRELKGRSGLSYGALAQKLHMSTSTVHRYCNGDAVPHEYAPVERFARVCRASADELVALHRKWILADEAKRRGARKPEAGGAADGPAEPDTLPERADAEAEAEAEPRTEAEPAPPQAPGLAPAPDDDLASAPAPGPAPAAGTVPEDVTPQEPGPGAVPAPRRRTSRKLRVLLTAVAVVALTVPLALTVHSLGRDEAADDGRADTAHSYMPVVPTGRASGSALPSSSASPSPTPDRTASSPAAKSSATPSPSARAPQSSGVPVHATISSYNWEEPCGQYYLLDEKPDDVPPNPPPQDRRSWARALGGVDGGDMKLALTLQGTSGEAVVLNALHVRVLGRNAALPWNAYSMGNGCGGGITPQSFDIDLDDSRPRSKPVAGEDAGVVVPAKDFPYRVSSTDVEVFHIDAHVEGHDVTWYLELEWTSGGRSGTLRIDDRGEPFRTSSLKTRPSFVYRPDTAQWVPDEE